VVNDHINWAAWKLAADTVASMTIDHQPIIRKHPSALTFHARRIYRRLALGDRTPDPVFNRQISITLAFEGGLLDDRAKTGELSNHGISYKSFPQLGVDGIINLTLDQAAEIYYSGALPDGTKTQFGWQHLRFNIWPEPPAAKCFDLTVNPGMGHGLEILMAALKGLNAPGGVIAGWRDPALLIAIRGVDGAALLEAIRSADAAYYTERARTGKVPASYLPGLLRRALS
jgi:lysozyme family protein